jgi:hypothetical protein
MIHFNMCNSLSPTGGEGQGEGVCPGEGVYPGEGETP